MISRKEVPEQKTTLEMIGHIEVLRLFRRSTHKHLRTQTDRQTDIHPDIQTSRHPDSHCDIQTDIQACIHTTTHPHMRHAYIHT